MFRRIFFNRTIVLFKNSALRAVCQPEYELYLVVLHSVSISVALVDEKSWPSRINRIGSIDWLTL